MASGSRMSEQTLPVSVFFLGWEKVRLEADVILPVPVGTALDDQDALQRQFVRVVLDLKHSYPMRCEFCGLPAQENHLNLINAPFMPPKGRTWLGISSPGPHANAYVHSVCEMAGPCGKKAQGMANMSAYMAILTGTPLDRAWIQHDDFEKVRYPKNGSCAYCQKDETIGKATSRCSKCKATLYCNSACQREDWSRHRKTCKWIKGVRLVHIDGEVDVWKENPEPLSPSPDFHPF